MASGARGLHSRHSPASTALRASEVRPCPHAPPAQDPAALVAGTLFVAYRATQLIPFHRATRRSHSQRQLDPSATDRPSVTHRSSWPSVGRRSVHARHSTLPAVLKYLNVPGWHWK